MIERNTVVALSPRTFQMKRREYALENTKPICRFMDTAIMVGAWEGLPARLVVIPEMAIQGMIAHTCSRQSQARKGIRDGLFPVPRPRSSVARRRRSTPISPRSFIW